MKKITTLLLLMLFYCLALDSAAQSVIKIEAGTDVISDAYETAASGDIIELVTDGGSYIESSDFVIEKGKKITIRAAEGLTVKPKWTASGGWALIQPADGVTLKGISFDGTLGGGHREVGIRGAEPEWNELQIGYVMKIYDCDFYNFNYAIYGEDNNQLDTLLIEGCTFQKMSNQAIQFSGGKIAPGQVKNFICQNSTFWDIGGTAIDLQSTALDANPQAKFLVNHVTIHNAADGNINAENIDGAIIKNSIITNSGSALGYACVIYGKNSVVSNLLYHNLSGVNLQGEAAEDQLSNLLAGVDPLYASAVSGNFTLMTNSMAINAGDDGKSLGDSRWWPENNTKYIFIAEGENEISTALASAVDGQTLVLITDGGIYHEDAKLIVNKKIILKAAEGLKQKPVLTSGSTSAMIEISKDFLLKGVILDGALGGTLTATGITNTPNTSGYNLTVLESDFLNFSDEGATKGFGIFGDPSSVIDSVLIQNCYFAHIQDMGISFNDPLTSTGSVNHFIVENSTFWKMNSEAIYVDGFDSNVATKDPQVYVNKVTVYDCGSYNIIPHYIDSATITNSIVVLPASNTDFAPAKIYGTHSKVENFLYYNTRDIDLSSGATDFQLFNLIIQENPLFTDAENGKFYYPVNSPAVLFKEDGGVLLLGDDRWCPNISFPSNIHWGTTNNSLNGLTITWNNQTTNDSLRWGYTTNYEKGIFPGIKRNNYQIGENPEYLFDYKFPKLNPSAKLYYSIKFNGIWGSMKTFTTSVDTASSKFSFIVGGDQQNGDEKWQKLSSMAAADKPDFGIMVGDIIDNSLYPDLWEKYYDFGKDYLENVLTYYTHGNHVYYDAESGNAALNQLVLPGNEKWYSVKQGNTLFICLLSEATLSTQWTYLKNLLQSSNATWKVVYFHRPFFTSGGHAGEMDAVIPYWWKAFDDYGVNVILNGHDHTYTRSKPMNLNVSTTAPVAMYGSGAGQGRLQMLTGAMGASPYGEQEGWWVGVTKSVDNYVRFQVDGNKMHFDAIDENGVLVDSLTLHSEGTITSLESGNSEIPKTYRIQQNYPNPFNSNTNFTYYLPQHGKVILKVYNMFGDEVRTLINEEQVPGQYEANFDASSLASGIYYYRFQSGSFDETKKMVLLR